MAESCKICGNFERNKIHNAREMMFGTRDRFDYLECGSCGTLGLLNVPDLNAHYPDDYYSLQEGHPHHFAPLKRRVAARLIGKYLVTGRGVFGSLLTRNRRDLAGKFPFWFRDLPVPIGFDSRVLDYGCGTGDLLRTLSAFGFRRLTGADPFIGSDLRFPNVTIHKKSFAELSSPFDLIMLHHSFEHLPDPDASLRHVNRLLSPGAAALIRIPVVNLAWERYGVNWVQLDPPRHVFLYTERSFRMIAERAGLEVAKVVYDSEAFQFYGSEQYAMDIPMNDPRSFTGVNESSIFSREQMDTWAETALELNRDRRGDQACFYLRRTGDN